MGAFLLANGANRFPVVKIRAITMVPHNNEYEQV
ncbi:hypothetical protein SAMN05421578_104307 [Paenibacillus macquariensis]|uniref:Uncharacterized protein n=1 Tax=Paenibacillus macquariensis TaxID=948756 RepID=A0ABY1JVL2_9BACL|nr:hypothetical protein SAMN05421578_104307 [Paenibacillus macquariensis]